MELSLLDPDVATLISRGDSLVLQVQKVDLERALRINTTTGELRVARTALKASSEVTKKTQRILSLFFHVGPNRIGFQESRDRGELKYLSTWNHHGIAME